jgi:hypothetical protein
LGNNDIIELMEYIKHLMKNIRDKTSEIKISPQSRIRLIVSGELVCHS